MRAAQQSPDLCIEPRTDSPTCATDREERMGKVDTCSETPAAAEQPELNQVGEELPGESLQLTVVIKPPESEAGSGLPQDLDSAAVVQVHVNEPVLVESEVRPAVSEASVGESLVTGTEDSRDSVDTDNGLSNSDSAEKATAGDQSGTGENIEDLICHEEIDGDDSSTTIVAGVILETDINNGQDDDRKISESSGEDVKIKEEIDDEIKEEPSTKEAIDEDGVEFCKCCGCYGLASEFYEREFCTRACHDSWMFASNNSKKLGKADITRKMKLIEYNVNASSVQELGDGDVKMESVEGDIKLEFSSNGKVTKKKTASRFSKKKKHPSKGVNGKELNGVKAGKLGTKCVKPKDILLSKGKVSPISRPEFVSEEFDWNKYLAETKSKAAPLQLFREPQMPPLNPFRVNMLLEAIDPQHQSLICVVSVQELQGYRIKLHFEGFSDSYDFWVNADSFDIFPANWSKEKGLELQPPPGTYEAFDWEQYAAERDFEVADRDLFAITKDDVDPDPDVEPGMKMEAVDMRNQALVCVASVAKIMGDRVLVHFDSWDSIYDYWTDFSSPFIFPVGHCEKNSIPLTPPNNFKTDFDWDLYLKETDSTPVPENSFRPLPGIFRRGYKVECVDKRNPYLIRVATISEVEGNNVFVHFDNWPTMYDYKLYELSPDIHPVGWCAHTGHPLQPPPKTPWKGACSTFGCLGLGHIRGPKYLTHNSEKNCPYSTQNHKKDWILKDRFTTIDKIPGHTFKDNSSNVEPTNSKLHLERLEESPKSKQKSEPKVIRTREKRASSSSTIEASPKRPRIDRKSKSSIKSRSPSPQPYCNGIGMSMTTRKSSNRNDVPGAGETVEIVRKSRSRDLGSPSNEMLPTCTEPVVRNKKKPSLPETSKPAVASVPWSHSIDTEVAPAVCLKTVVGDLREETVARWKVDQLARFISQVPGCEHTASTFSDQLIDGESFLMLSQNDFLNVMGLKLGPAIKLCNVIKMINANSDPK